MSPLRSPLWLRLMLALLLVASAPARADSPESAVRAYMDDLRHHGLAVVADHLHRDEMARFKSMLLPALLRRDFPQQREVITGLFGPDATPQSVAAMPADRFVTAIMRLVEQRLAARGVRFGEADVIGTVPEGEVIHVVTRTRTGAGPMSITGLEVMSVRLDGPHWRLMLSGQIDGLARAIAADVQRQR